jgi:hypothetical protein
VHARDKNLWTVSMLKSFLVHRSSVKTGIKAREASSTSVLFHWMPYSSKWLEDARQLVRRQSTHVEMRSRNVCFSREASRIHTSSNTRSRHVLCITRRPGSSVVDFLAATSSRGLPPRQHFANIRPLNRHRGTSFTTNARHFYQLNKQQRKRRKLC